MLYEILLLYLYFNIIVVDAILIALTYVSV